MRPSLRRWLDWAMSDLILRSQPRAAETAIRVEFEKGSRILSGPAVPWNADAVVVEAPLRLPLTARSRSDFALWLPGQSLIAPELLRREEGDESRHRIRFRLAVPREEVHAELRWKTKTIARFTIPVLSEEDFFDSLTVIGPTVSVAMAGKSIGARQYVGARCRGLTTGVTLHSHYGLAPLVDMEPNVIFQGERGNETMVVVPLGISRLAAKEALFVAASPKAPRRNGTYGVVWRLGDRFLRATTVTATGRKRFEQSLYATSSSFEVLDKYGACREHQQAAIPADVVRIGPTFHVASREAEIAGVAKLRVRGVRNDGSESSILFESELLVAEGASLFRPGMIDVAELFDYSAFELQIEGRTLAVLPVNPVPRALFDAEGGYKPAPEFTWTRTAEDELTERLTKLSARREETK